MKVLFKKNACTLCGACMDACKEKNGVARIRIEGGENGRKRTQCRQCAKPACAYACTYEAIYRNRTTGAIEVEEDACQACHACVHACPFQAIFVHPDTGIACICDLCQGSPACVEACPTGALWLQNEAE